MRRIYLIRHGLPEFPGSGRYCLGRADLPLSETGRRQAAELGRRLEAEKLTVFSSPLRRALDTAKQLSPTPTVIDDLQELAMGHWDGLGFEEIKKRWPELYEARGESPTQLPPGAEDPIEGEKRFALAVEQALESSRGDIAIVTHAAVMQAFICRISGDERYRSFEHRPDYCGGYLIEKHENGQFLWRKMT